jgi:Protein of unknown function (DUF1573)
LNYFLHRSKTLQKASSEWTPSSGFAASALKLSFSQAILEFPMRILVLCCAAFAQFCGSASAQSQTEIVPPESRQFDFGTVAKSSKTEHRFVLRNPFQSEMRIQSVRASCGCTTPILESQVVKPGESVGLIAHFNTDRFTGEKKATLTVSITQPIYTELQLNVKGYIRSDVVVHPGEAAFGTVPESTEKKMTLVLDYAGRPDWQIKGIACPYSFIKADFKEVSRGNGRVRYSIDVLLDASAPEGFIENQLVVQTNDRRLTSFPILVTASCERPLKTSPSSLALGTVKPNEPIQQRLTMTGKNEFKIISIQSDVAEIRCDLPASANRVHMLNLTVVPRPNEQITAETRGKIEILTDAETEKSIVIPLSFALQTQQFAEINRTP